MPRDRVQREATRHKSAGPSGRAGGGPGSRNDPPADYVHELEMQYRSIFEESLDAISIVDMEGRHVEVNPAYCEMLGYTRDELIGMPGSLPVHPDQHHKVAEAMQAIRDGGDVRTEMTLVRKDGSLIQVDGRATAFTYRGKPHILGVSRDVTDRVRAEEELRKKEAEYRGVFESSSDGLIIGNAEGVVVEVNPAACRLYGYAHDEFVGLSVSTLIHPDYRHRSVEHARRIEDGGTVQVTEIALRKDGTSFHAEVRGTRFMYRGQPMRLAIVRDITERVQAEEALREREEQYRSIFEATTNGLGIVDMDGRLVEVNPAYCQMLGYTREELIGRDAAGLMHPDDAHQIAEGMRAIEEEGYSVQTTTRLVRKDGALLHVEGHGAAFIFKGEPHILGVVRDVTERVRAYELLEQRVEERTRELATLLEVSHNVSSTLELQPLLGLILEQLKAVVDFDGATVMGLEGQELVNLYRQGPGRSDQVVQRRFPAASQKLLWDTLQHREPVIVADVRGDSPFAEEYRRINGELMNTTLSYVRSWMGVPMVLKEQVVGVLSLASSRPNSYTLSDASLVRGIANQAAVAIENARLYERSEQRTRELSTLLEVSQNVSSTLELQRLLDLILDQIAEVVRYAGASISLIEGDESELVAFRGRGSVEVAVGLRIPVKSMEPGPESWGASPLIIDDVRGDTPDAVVYRRNESRLLDSSFAYVRSWMAVPLIVNDRLVGVLTLNGDEPNLYTRQHAELVHGIASQAAIAIENARLYERSEQRTQELAALLDVARDVTSILELQPLLGLILDQLKLVASYSGAAVFELQGDDLVVLVRRAPGPDPDAGPTRYSRVEAGWLWELVQGGEPFVIDDVRGDTELARAYQSSVGQHLKTTFAYERSFLCAPMMTRERVIGVLTLSSHEPGYFTTHHADLAMAIARQAAVAIENARLYQRAQEAAVLEERQRLSRELHDSVSQALYSIGLGARTARTMIDRDPSGVAEPLDFVLAQAARGLAEMRALIFELRPEALEQEGLVTALVRQAEATQARYDLEVKLAVGEEPDVPLPLKEALFRVAQEALHNIAKHAQATQVHVALLHSAEEIVLEIRDNGHGFDPNASFPGHLGLRSMHERVERLGGRLDIESATDTGTVVRARISESAASPVAAPVRR